MILVTGGTGFIGKALIRHLVAEGHQVRTLLHPSPKTPELPKGVPVEVAISDISDERSLRAALSGVDTIFHLAGGEWQGVSANLSQIEIQGTRALLEVAKGAGVQRIFYLSHLGADRASAYPVIKVKGIVEEFIRRSGIDYTILQSGLVYGPSDHFSTAIAKMLAIFPFMFMLPGQGDALVQPIWVEDLVTCLTWSLGLEETVNQTLRVGGPEFLSIRQVVEEVIGATGMKRYLAGVQPSYLRLVAVFLEYFFPFMPVSVYWVDYLADDRICEIDSVSRHFGLLPVRFNRHLEHLKGHNWRRQVLQDMRRRPTRI